MTYLAQNYGKGPVYLKEIAGQEDISEKYLSLIVIPLRGAGLVNSIRGAYGGYELAREPSQITLKEIFDVLEGDYSLVNCVKNPSYCPRTPICPTRDIWVRVDREISEVLSSFTLADLIKIGEEKLGNAAAQDI